jgi:hypothetical protein
MRNIWYGDNRDLVKWSVLLYVAEQYSADRILQIAYFREGDFEKVEIDGTIQNIPAEVKAHFRDIRKINELASEVKISVFDMILADRLQYIEKACEFISLFNQERCIVFLDPDTGLEPERPSLNHVLEKEAKVFWDILKPLDVFLLYQHQTNRSGVPWEEAKRIQFARAIGVPQDIIKIARGTQVARDVAFFYTQKL